MGGGGGGGSGGLNSSCDTEESRTSCYCNIVGNFAAAATVNVTTACASISYHVHV